MKMTRFYRYNIFSKWFCPSPNCWLVNLDAYPIYSDLYDQQSYNTINTLEHSGNSKRLISNRLSKMGIAYQEPILRARFVLQ